MEKSPTDLFHELTFYTLDHPDRPYFIHQHAVDAFTAQHADSGTKPIAIIFSLAGLYLYLEKNYTGRQVQLAHMHMAKGTKTWPKIALPEDRGRITVSEVMAAEAGPIRDRLIRAWCLSVWQCFRTSHQIIQELTGKLLLKSN